MEKKYQIFVSSTFKDLVEERQSIMRAILDMGHIPSGMEYFSASPLEQFKYISKVIDQCDYYVPIIGGSTAPPILMVSVSPKRSSTMHYL